MFVHFISALVQFHVIVKANTERDRKTDSRPKRVATADPIPEFKHVGGVNAKCGNRFGIGGKSHKMFCNGLFITVKRFENSGLCRFRIRHRFQSRKRFRSHDKERFFNVHFLEGFGHVSAVDIGNKIDFGRIFAVSGFVCIRLQRFGDHHRTKIGTADADVHHITDFLARKSKPLARTNQMRERFHVFENSANFWHHVLAIDANRIISLIAESGMQDGAFFRRVDFFSREKFLAHRIKSGSRQKSAKLRHHVFVDQVLGIVQENSAGLGTELFGTLRVFCKHLAHIPDLRFRRFRSESFPFKRFRQFRHRVILSASAGYIYQAPI